MPHVLFTGFPGFLGSALLPRVLRRYPELDAVCLVQSRFRAQAEVRQADLEAVHPEIRGRITLLDGDITEPDLGLGDEQRARLAAEAVEVWHLAAVYDLSVPSAFATRVNVLGTQHVLDLCEAAPGLRRLQYVSTCYVSGRHPGIFRETDLVKPGQVFNNHYEATKHEAEVRVRRAMDRGLPATVYRPSVVVGDSATGVTQKYDGPYFLVRWLLRQPGPVAVLPSVGERSAFTSNIVPRDFVVDGMDALSGKLDAVGRTFALADPEPRTVEQIIATLGEATGKRVVSVPLPRRVAVRGSELGLSKITGIPASAIPYFTHPTHYDTRDATEALAPEGVTCPHFEDYADALVRFVRDNPTYSSAAMV